jgi:hypothetical protein
MAARFAVALLVAACGAALVGAQDDTTGQQLASAPGFVFGSNVAGGGRRVLPRRGASRACAARALAHAPPAAPPLQPPPAAIPCPGDAGMALVARAWAWVGAAGHACIGGARQPAAAPRRSHATAERCGTQKRGGRVMYVCVRLATPAAAWPASSCHRHHHTALPAWVPAPAGYLRVSSDACEIKALVSGDAPNWAEARNIYNNGKNSAKSDGTPRSLRSGCCGRCAGQGRRAGGGGHPCCCLAWRRCRALERHCCPQPPPARPFSRLTQPAHAAAPQAGPPLPSRASPSTTPTPPTGQSRTCLTSWTPPSPAPWMVRGGGAAAAPPLPLLPPLLLAPHGTARDWPTRNRACMHVLSAPVPCLASVPARAAAPAMRVVGAAPTLHAPSCALMLQVAATAAATHPSSPTRSALRW